MGPAAQLVSKATETTKRAAKDSEVALKSLPDSPSFLDTVAVPGHSFAEPMSLALGKA